MKPIYNILLDIETVSKDAYEGTSTTISCKITGLTVKATVTWKLDQDTIPASSITEGELNPSHGTQTSTLTVANPAGDRIYTCVVTSGLYSSDSAPSETSASLSTYCKFSSFAKTYHILLLKPLIIRK